MFVSGVQQSDSVTDTYSLVPFFKTPNISDIMDYLSFSDLLHLE